MTAGSNYTQRGYQRAEQRYGKACPDCGHSIGAHRGLDPITCIEGTDCKCQLETWKATTGNRRHR